MMDKVKLGDIAKISSGGTPSRRKRENWENGDIPWIKIKDLKSKYINSSEENITKYALENSTTKLYKNGTVLYTIFATIGEVAILNIDAATNQAIAGIEINERAINRDYLYYYLNSIKPKMIKKSRGVAQNNINLTILKNLEIKLVDISEQIKIAKKFDKVQEVIDMRKKQIEALDKLIKSQFEKIVENVEEEVCLNYYINSLNAGKSLAGELECKNKVLKTGSVSYDYFDEKQVKNLPIDYMPQKEHLVKKGDVIISRMNTAELVGACGYVWDNIENLYYPDRLWKANLNDKCNAIFIWQSIIQQDFKAKIRKICSGTSGSMKNISKEKFLSLKIKKVPIELQNQFSNIVKQINKRKVEIQNSLKELEKLQDSLSNKYFN